MHLHALYSVKCMFFAGRFLKTNMYFTLQNVCLFFFKQLEFDFQENMHVLCIYLYIFLKPLGAGP